MQIGKPVLSRVLSCALYGALIAAACGGARATATGVAKSHDAHAHAITIPAATLRQYVGRYRLAPGAVFSITLKADQLYAQLTGQPSVPIYTSARDKFFYKIVNAQITFKRDVQGKVDALVIHQNGRSLRAARINAATVVAGKAAAAKLAKHLKAERACFTERPVNVKTKAGQLFGLLTIPRGAKAAPAILLIPGSGPVNLNGDAAGLLTDHIYQQLAYALSCNGYAVLRYDKRGLGRSTGDGNDVTISDYRSDVLALAHTLAHEPGVASNKLILMGHSEGGLIAPYSAPKLGAQLRAMVLLEAPGEPLGKVVLTQTLREAEARGASQAELAKLKSQVQALEHAIRVSHGPTLQVPPSLKEFVLARAFAPAAGLLRSEMMLDPAHLIAQVKVPTLIVQGSADVQVGARNAKRLHAADPQASLVRLVHMTHDLIVAHGKPIDYATPPQGAPINPALIKHLVQWLNGLGVSADTQP